MKAAEIAARFGDIVEAGRDLKCRCPLCGGRLSLRDDGSRGILAKCWGACSGREVYDELRRCGFLVGGVSAPLTGEEIAARNAAAERKDRVASARARDLWAEGAPVVDSTADQYLRLRGLDVLSPYVGEHVPDVLRFLPRCRHSPRTFRPALLAKVEHVRRGHVATSVTYLAIDGSGKTTLDPPRKFFGPCKGAAVRLGIPSRGKWLLLGEGLETVLAAMQACALPGWAALSAEGIRSVVLPGEATHVAIAADNDRNGVGALAANEAAARFTAEGRRCRVFMPTEDGADWNDVLLGNATAIGPEIEAGHAA